ncbi:MAG: chromosomal replication initiator protein DnaA [Verrucomicrobia bacterium]|nr:chromosomal replication initiator protein DnaA [Verrucomicrobiota bacterium]MBI3870374.1 chromosomal replication initiator protein DnaA [Verrucomicrobiota bacterium]
MENAAERVWSAAQQTLRSLLNQDIFNLWFASIRAVSLEQETLLLEVPNDFCEVWLKDNYAGLLKDAVVQAAGTDLKIEFRAKNENLHGSAAGRLAEAQTRAQEKEKGAEKPKHPANGSTRGATAVAENSFNPRNTFENFVVGDNNTFAHAAAMAVAQAPGKTYNPLFLYGGVGLGKTHLLHAIGLHVSERKRNARVTYVSAERFTNEFIDGIQNGQLVRFRKRYRQSEVLLIDDIQFLAGKERIQEEFFHTFNALHEEHHQIVLTCDRPANEIQGLEQRLVSRFEWGLVTDMQPPDVETRMAILQKKECLLGVKLPPEILQFIAERIRSNIRRLEGAFIRVSSFFSLTRKPITIAVVEDLLRDVLHEENKTSVTIDVIQKIVADHYDIRVSDLTGKRRPGNIAFPRQVAMYLSRQLTDSSLNTIGEAFGGRDHGTVLHAVRQVCDRMSVEPNIRQSVSYIESQLLRSGSRSGHSQGSRGASVNSPPATARGQA